MKKVTGFVSLMLITIILIPFIIVRGCGPKPAEPTPSEEKDEINVRVYFDSENTVREMDLEEYVKGVVAAEMPAEFELEALKAQAVAARTYAIGRMLKLYSANDQKHPDADVCTDYAHCQAWVDKQQAMKNWGILSSYRYWNKIEKAVNETKGIVITYNGMIIDPVFHSNSGGRTENAEDVWGGSGVPYLKSVFSYGEDASSEYKTIVLVKEQDFIDRMKGKYSNFKAENDDILKEISIQEYSEGGRVKTLKVGNIVMKGTDFRSLFSLKSTNFKVERADRSTLRITTIGNGHGVGMSQWGANYLAKNGGNFEEILKYYYSGVELGNELQAFSMPIQK